MENLSRRGAAHRSERITPRRDVFNEQRVTRSRIPRYRRRRDSSGILLRKEECCYYAKLRYH